MKFIRIVISLLSLAWLLPVVCLAQGSAWTDDVAKLRAQIVAQQKQLDEQGISAICLPCPGFCSANAATFASYSKGFPGRGSIGLPQAGQNCPAGKVGRTPQNPRWQ